MHSFTQYPSRGEHSLFLQSQQRFSLDSPKNTFTLYVMLVDNAGHVFQLEGAFVKYFTHLWCFGKCCLTSFKKNFQMFALTFSSIGD